jgi:hypothetical protein
MFEQEKLDDDQKIRDRMDVLERLGLRFDPEYIEEYDRLHYEYYVTNDDIRLHWKSY